MSVEAAALRRAFEPVAHLLADLAAAYDESPWHGPSFRAALDGLTAGDAAARPVAGAHSAGEIVLHVTAWMDAGARRLDARASLAPTADWPATPGPADDDAWRDALRALDDAYHDLSARVASLTADDLDGPIAGASPSEQGATVAELVSGLVQHLAYHGGQIALLRKALGGV